MVLNYIGSKKSLLPFIHKVYDEIYGEYKGVVFGDIFSGSGVISHSFALRGCRVISNDIEGYSYIITKALTSCRYSDFLQRCIDEMNYSTEEIEGLFYNTFSEGSGKMFFTPENAKKFDYIRSKLEEDKKTLSELDYTFLLASLITSMDKVANTTSVYGAFLKKYKKSAQQKLVIHPIHRVEDLSIDSIVFSMDALKLAKEIKFDVVYLDPPYNQRQYSANYSPLNFAVEYHPELKVRGKTSILEGNYISPFCQKKNAKIAMGNLIHDIQATHILLSYNNEGVIPLEEMKELLLQKGTLTLYIKSYRRYKSKTGSSEGKDIEIGGNEENKKVEEYLFHILVGQTRVFKQIYIE